MTAGIKAMPKRQAVKAKKKRGFLYELRVNRILFLMLIPAAVYFILNNYLPIFGMYLAFTRFNFADGIFKSPFIGLENFRFLWESGKLVKLTINTIGYNLAFILIGNFTNVASAILLSRLGCKIFKKITQSVMFLPYFVSYVILNVIVYNLFNYDLGFFNGILHSLGQESYDFYNTPSIWPFILIILYIWKQIGYGTVIYLATITGISPELYEAAEIDGANVFQQIRYITIPLLTPTFITLLLFSHGGIMKGQFDLFYQVIGNNGVLYDATDILDTFVYRSLKQDFDVGMSTAAGVYQSIFGFIVIMVSNALIKRNHPEQSLF